MKKRFLVLSLMLLFTLVLAVGSASAEAHAPDAIFRTHLTGAAAGNDSRSQGQAHFKLDGETLHFISTVSRFKSGDPFAAHIHISAVPGGNGPPVVTLCGGGPGPAQPACGSPGVLARGMQDLGDFGTSSATLLQAISENRAYVNVHTPAFPGGEIRGQLVLIGR